MKKILLLILVLSSIFLGYTFSDWRPFIKKEESTEPAVGVKKPILKVALVADSHNENELLARALRQAQGLNADFVIGLGDYTNLGTVEELEGAKAVFDKSGLEYYVTPGDRDGWESRQQGGVDYFEQIFGQGTRIFERENILFVILDNSDIYKGISEEGWSLLEGSTHSVSSGSSVTLPLVFVFAHKTPFHPESKHVMGADSKEVSRQARKLIELLEEKRVDGFFSGDLHFFAQFKSPGQSVKITTIGAVASERNFQGPRFGILKVYDDYSWEVEDVEIK